MLYSVDVDYYTYGMCRLVVGAYYCGPLATAAPYKGLTSTKDTPHIGSDEYFESGKLLPKAATGTTKVDSTYDKLVSKPLNPDYYNAKDKHNWQQPINNNGLAIDHPTHSTGLTTAVYSNGNIGQNLTSRFRFGAADKNPQAYSNYAMRPGAAALYNDGLHIVNGTSSGKTNPSGRTYFSVLDTQQEY